MEVKEIRISDYQHHPENPNTHPDFQLVELAESLNEFEQVKNVVVWRGYFLAGHGLAESAKKSNRTHLFAVDVSDWDEEKAIKFMISDNRLPELSEIDSTKLDFLFKNRVQSKVPGVSEDYLAEIAQLSKKKEIEIEKEKESSGDSGTSSLPEVENLAQDMGVELGQIWQIGNHRLLCGDCRDDSLMIRFIDGYSSFYGMHDPPYGIESVKDNKFGSGKGKAIAGYVNYNPVYGDDEPYDPSVIFKYTQDNIIWGANYFSSKLPDTKSWIVWDKTGGREWNDEDLDYSLAELAWTSFNKQIRVYKHLWIGMVKEGEEASEKRIHPNQKPYSMISRIALDYFEDVTRPILDFYAGSGTTMIACEIAGLKCFSVEVVPDYVAVTLSRMREKFNIEPVLISS